MKRCFTAVQNEELRSECARLAFDLNGLITSAPALCLKTLAFMNFTQMININRIAHFTIFQIELDSDRFNFTIA